MVSNPWLHQEHHVPPSELLVTPEDFILPLNGLLSSIFAYVAIKCQDFYSVHFCDHPKLSYTHETKHGETLAGFWLLRSNSSACEAASGFLVQLSN